MNFKYVYCFNSGTCEVTGGGSVLPMREVVSSIQHRRLDGKTSRSLALEAVRGALADAGIELASVDGITSGALSTTLIYDLRLGPAWQGFGFGLGMITEAVAAQMRTLDYASSFQLGHPIAFECADRLTELAPRGLEHVFFSNSGSEAVDSALKIALAYHRANGEAGRVRLIRQPHNQGKGAALRAGG